VTPLEVFPDFPEDLLMVKGTNVDTAAAIIVVAAL